MQRTRLPCPLPSPGICQSSCPLNQWCYPTISSSATLFSFCLQSFLALGSFQMSQLFASGSHSIGASASPSVPVMNIQSWFPLGSTGLISLLFKGLSRVFSITTAWNHQFFGTQHSLWSNSQICTWLLEKPQLSLSRPYDSLARYIKLVEKREIALPILDNPELQFQNISLFQVSPLVCLTAWKA